MNPTKTVLAGASLVLILSGMIFVRPPVAFAAATLNNPVNKKSQTHCNSFETPTQIKGGKNDGKWYCKAKSAPQPAAHTNTTCGGTNYHYYTPSIDIGCRGQGNPIMDALFGFIQFLSYGVGLVVVGSIIVGGIQYSASRGDPQATAMAINRIRSSLIALIIYIFGYAFLNYLLPGFVL